MLYYHKVHFSPFISKQRIKINYTMTNPYHGNGYMIIDDFVQEKSVPYNYEHTSYFIILSYIYLEV